MKKENEEKNLSRKLSKKYKEKEQLINAFITESLRSNFTLKETELAIEIFLKSNAITNAIAEKSIKAKK